MTVTVTGRTGGTGSHGHGAAAQLLGDSTVLTVLARSRYRVTVLLSTVPCQPDSVIPATVRVTVPACESRPSHRHGGGRDRGRGPPNRVTDAGPGASRNL